MTKEKDTIPQEITIWDDKNELAEIKKMYGASLSEGEFITFVKMGKALNLNPFMRQIWAVKYGNTPAQVFVGRDGYLVNAMRHPQYRGMLSSAYYSNDIMKRLPDGTLHHESNYNNRGRLVGAYAIVHRKDLDFPIIKEVLLSEYNTSKSNWAKMPETMIKKVAEAQALRFAFPEIFQGTWHEAEDWKDSNSHREQSKTKTYTYQKPKPVEREPIQDAEYQEVETEEQPQAEPQTPDQSERITKGLNLIKEKFATLDEESQAGFAFQCQELTGKEFPDADMKIDQITALFKIIREL